jgi:hypothetical protein
MVTLESRLFICRYWIAYWEAKMLLVQAFPPDGEYPRT